MSTDNMLCKVLHKNDSITMLVYSENDDIIRGSKNFDVRSFLNSNVDDQNIDRTFKRELYLFKGTFTDHIKHNEMTICFDDDLDVNQVCLDYEGLDAFKKLLDYYSNKIVKKYKFK